MNAVTGHAPPQQTQPKILGGEPWQNFSRDLGTPTSPGTNPSHLFCCDPLPQGGLLETSYKRAASRPDPTKRATTRATSPTRVPTSNTPLSTGRYPWQTNPGPPRHTQSRGGTTSKFFYAPPQPSELPPGPPAWPAPLPLTHLTAEGRNPGKNFPGPHGHTQSGERPPNKIFCAPPQLSELPPGPTAWPDPAPLARLEA